MDKIFTARRYKVLVLLLGLLSSRCSASSPAPTPDDALTILTPVAGTYPYDQPQRVEWVSRGEALSCDYVDVALYSNPSTGREYFGKTHAAKTSLVLSSLVLFFNPFFMTGIQNHPNSLPQEGVRQRRRRPFFLGSQGHERRQR